MVTPLDTEMTSGALPAELILVMTNSQTRISYKKNRRMWVAHATAVAQRRCLRIFHLIMENPQVRISYNTLD